MSRLARFAIPVAVLACALGGFGQQRKRSGASKQPEAAPPTQPSAPLQAIRNNNLGLALMDRQQFSEALGKFQTACIMDPQSDIACLNTGIALLNMQQFDEAKKVLTKSSERDPKNPGAWFNLGLVEKTAGRPQIAINDFQKVAALDPNDADTQYFLGQVYSEQQQYPMAIAAFEKAVKLDPFHASAELGLAEAAQHADNIDSAMAHLNRFRTITSEDLGRPIGDAYGEQGKYSRAQELPRDTEQVLPASEVRFADVTANSGLPLQTVATPGRIRPSRDQEGASSNSEESARSGAASLASGVPGSLASFLGSGACIFDFDGDGKPDIFLVNADGKGNAALYRNNGNGKFVNVTKAAGLEFQGEGTGCAVGDYDNDHHPDLSVSSNIGVTLYHNEGNGTFKNVTDASGIRTEGLVLGLTFVDYDHDGDLDLYVTRFNDFPPRDWSQPFAFTSDATPPGNVLWRNKGNGTFMDWTRETGLAGTAASVGAIGSHLFGDRLVDLVVTGWQKSPSLFLNQRDGTFRAVQPWAAEMPGPTAGITALDFDKDDWMDLAFTHWASPGLSLWRNVAGKSFERVSLPDPGWRRGWGIASLDYDNDGWVDLVAVGENFSGEGRILLLRNEGPQGFRDVTQETGLDKIVLHDPRAVIPFDQDGNGSTDLLITQNGLPPVLLKSTGGKNNWLELAFKGGFDNSTGIGISADVFAGVQRQKWEVPGASGYLGQGPPEISAGLGSLAGTDVIRLFWPTGILQNELQVAGGKREVINEFDPRDTAH